MTTATTNGRDGLLRMKELAAASGVSAGTIKHYLREGLLPDPVRTSRNMAWYPPDFVDRIRLIKQLQEERFLPLRVIRSLLAEDPHGLRAALEDRLLERALAAEGAREPVPDVLARTGVPAAVVERLAELGVLDPPGDGGLSASDAQIVEAIGGFRAHGYDERIGFTVYDTLRYKRALEGLVDEEVAVLTERLTGTVEPDRAAELMAAGAEPLQELISALHAKLLVAALRRQRAVRA